MRSITSVANGANRDRTGDLLLAKSMRERAAAGRLRISVAATGPTASPLRVSAGRIRAAEASIKLPDPHVPSKRGIIRANDAVTPSRKASVSPRRSCSDASRSRAPSTQSTSPAHNVARVDCITNGALRASSAASACAATRTSLPSTRRSQSPSDSASSPGTRRPVRSRSSAVCWQESAGSVTRS